MDQENTVKKMLRVNHGK